MNTTNKKIHYCSKCKQDPQLWDCPAEATGLFVGTYYNESEWRIMPIRAWLCDMHADEMESGRFVR